jgi:hypothetical protein
VSEILDRESEIREAAAKCETIGDLAKHFGWHIQSAVRANDIHRLGLPIVRKSTGAPREAQSVPKPVGKGAKPKPKGGGDG